MRWVTLGVVVVAWLLPAWESLAQESPESAADSGTSHTIHVVDDTSEVATRSRDAIVRDTRAVTVVGRQQIEEAAPRTTPEILSGAAGVSVQKTNHAGGSPYIRGMTGQQTLLMIDGFRLNTSIARSGPNQYLNTIDPWVVDRIEVLRGSGSVLFGSDAIGGVVNLISRRPRADNIAVRGLARGATADRAASGRAEVDLTSGGVGVLAGVGGRRFGDLRGGGPLEGAEVPVYDGRKQLFTGYSEMSGDAKVVVPVGEEGTVTAAALMLRQLNAPRTDRCTEPLECRFFDEQFYDIAYTKYDGDHGVFRDVSVGVAVMRTREKRRRERQSRGRTEIELDQIIGLGLVSRASAPTLRWGNHTALRISFGAEGYFDMLSSQARNQSLSTGEVTRLVRGKYLDDSNYLRTSGFAFAELALAKRLSLTAGFRLGLVRAEIADDPEGGTNSFTQDWFVPVASLGARLAVTDWLAVIANVDQGFRAPNLDDLTARSQEGPGYQIANPMLDPETALTFEGGVLLTHERLRGGFFAFRSNLDDFIDRDATNCPSDLEAQCGDAENVFVLANAESARVIGVEGALEALFPIGRYTAGLFANATWTRATRELADGSDQPLSKIPPFHGRLGVRTRGGGTRGRRYFAEAAVAWAAEQDRLSPADIADRRIPGDGTPAYARLDVRVGVRLSDTLRASLTVENLTDESYRVHGSGVDGAGVGAIVQLAGAISP